MRRVIVLALAAALVPATAQAAKQPDLTISKAGSAGASAAWTVKNGGGNAGKSTTGLFLSKDGKGRDASAGTFAQKAIKAKKSATGTLKINVPSGLAAGRYTLLVCADAANKVKESKETNNCRAAGTITVSGAAPAPAPAPAPATTTTTAPPAAAGPAPTQLAATPAPT